MKRHPRYRREPLTAERIGRVGSVDVVDHLDQSLSLVSRVQSVGSARIEIRADARIFRGFAEER